MDLQSTWQILRDWYLTFKSQSLKVVQENIPFFKDLDIFDLLVVYTILLFVTVKLYNYMFNGRLNKEKNIFRRIYTGAFKILIQLPLINRYVKKQTEKLLLAFEHEINKLANKKTFKIPDNGMTLEKIQERLQEWTARDQDIYSTGKLSGGLYIITDKKYESQMQEFTKNFIYSNPMHFDSFPAARQMEAEVIRMTCELFGQDKEGIGILTSGGTESILMAVLAHRNWAKETKGITQPNLVLPETAHVAFRRACEYFCVEQRVADIDPKTQKVKVSNMKKLIDSNTIMIIGSAPHFPSGIIDDIVELGKLAKSKKVGLHVDACLGGFVIAFAKDKLPPFDFSVEGVTSISCDNHKYGLAPKGASVCMFKTRELRRYAFFANSQWSGGVYVVPTMSGSRGAVGISGAWYSMMSLGRKKYTDLSANIMDATQNIAKAIKQIPELQVQGNPQVCVVGFISKVKTMNIFAIQQIMSTKGWNLSSIQYPPGIHISVTHQNCGNWRVLVKDLADAVQEFKENPTKYKGGTNGALYGTTASIPDKGLLDETVKMVLDAILKI